MSIDESPTTQERYTRATRSSHLELDMEHLGDVDTLIAAGLARESLGTHIWRLMSEFDGVRASLHRGAINQTERLLILAQLKTLRETKTQLGAFAVIRATKGKFETLNNSAVAAITGRVLDVALDPNCHHCDGRGFSGGTHRGERQTMCRPCRGSGDRRDWVGKTDEEQRFAKHLLMEMDRALAGLSSEVRRNRHAVQAAKDLIASETGMV